MNFLIVRRRHSHFKKNGNASVQGNLDVAVPEGRRKDRLSSHWMCAFINRHHLLSLRQERIVGNLTGRERWDLHHTLAFRSVPPTSPLPPHRSLRAQRSQEKGEACIAPLQPHPVERIYRLTFWAGPSLTSLGSPTAGATQVTSGLYFEYSPLEYLSFEYPSALEMASALQSRQLGLKRVQNDRSFIKEWERQKLSHKPVRAQRCPATRDKARNVLVWKQFISNNNLKSE